MALPRFAAATSRCAVRIRGGVLAAAAGAPSSLQLMSALPALGQLRQLTSARGTRDATLKPPPLGSVSVLDVLRLAKNTRLPQYVGDTEFVSVAIQLMIDENQGSLVVRDTQERFMKSIVYTIVQLDVSKMSTPKPTLKSIPSPTSKPSPTPTLAPSPAPTPPPAGPRSRLRDAARHAALHCAPGAQGRVFGRAGGVERDHLAGDTAAPSFHFLHQGGFTNVSP